MRLLGTLTSPFVRRVRVLGLELGLELELVDINTAEGRAALTALSPLQKYPVLDLNGVGVLDSHAICELLLIRHGHGPLRAALEANRVVEGNLMHVIDGALDAGIRMFYCRRDGVDLEAIPFLRAERDRIARTLTWLDQHVRGPWCAPEDGFGLAELALITTLEWMRLRDIAALEPHANLLALLAAHAGRPSLVATRPPST